MPPITVQRIASDGDAGFHIEWLDAANLDGEPLTGFFHLTGTACEDLVAHMRVPNRAPEEKLHHLQDQMMGCAGGVEGGAVSMEDVAEAFAAAYSELVLDSVDRVKLGLKAITRDGHEDLVAVRAGAPVRPWNARGLPASFQAFIDAGQPADE